MYDEKEKCIAQPQEIYKIIETHFKNHFNKSNANKVQKFNTPAQSLRNKITTEEISKAVAKMSNNQTCHSCFVFRPEHPVGGAAGRFLKSLCGGSLDWLKRPFPYFIIYNASFFLFL